MGRMVKPITVHEARCASIKWCYENTYAARNGLMAREYTHCAVPNVSMARSRMDLLKILHQLSLGLFPRDYNGGEIVDASVFIVMARNWTYESHLKLVNAVDLLALRACPDEWVRNDFRPNEVLIRQAAIYAAEQRQSSLEDLVPLLVEASPENQMAGAW